MHNLHWTQTADGWRLADERGRLHRCPAFYEAMRWSQYPLDKLGETVHPEPMDTTGPEFQFEA